jgi:uncharacterized protein (TIGR00251 family)
LGNSPLRETAEGAILDVWVQPRASKDRIAGVHGGAVKLQIASPPVDGEANDALIRFVAKALGRPRSTVEIVRGLCGRRKTLLLRGLTPAQVQKGLGLAAATVAEQER